MKQNDGLYEDWKAVGNDLRCAISKFDTELKWQRKQLPTIEVMGY